MSNLSVTDFMADEFLDDELIALGKDFERFEEIEGKGTRELWSLLGRIYALGARIENNGLAKGALLSLVNEDPVVQNSPWKPEKKTAHELLLVRLLSIKPETKAKKSQWFSAIRAAKKSDIDYSQSAFECYIADVGGINEARRSLTQTNSPRPTYDDLTSDMMQFLDEKAQTFEAPDLFSTESELPGAFGLVLVHGKAAGSDVVPIATISNQALVEKAMTRVLAENAASLKDLEREYRRETDAIVSRERKNLKALYAKYRKSRSWANHKPTFAEFVELSIIESDELTKIDKQIGNLYDRILGSQI